MNNLIYLNNDPIILELNNSVDKNSTKKMIAFKHFNNDMNLLDKYLEDNNYYINSDAYRGNLINPKSQLEFTF